MPPTQSSVQAQVFLRGQGRRNEPVGKVFPLRQGTIVLFVVDGCSSVETLNLVNIHPLFDDLKHALSTTKTHGISTLWMPTGNDQLCTGK
jgi:hypothetical protein